MRIGIDSDGQKDIKLKFFSSLYTYHHTPRIFMRILCGADYESYIEKRAVAPGKSLSGYR